MDFINMSAEEMAKQLLDAKVAYYTATPIMGDADFDELLRALKEKDPENPAITVIGTPIVNGQKVDLKYQMVSTEKTLAVADLDKYWRRISSVASDTEDIVISQKIDGLSMNLTYFHGKLVRAATSGDGFVGSDKTEKVMSITSIPKEVPNNWSGQVSGEVFLTDANFEQLNEILAAEGSDLQKTSRNSTAGLINSENLKNASKKLALISYRVWGVYEDDKSDMFGSYEKYSDQLEKAREMGFESVDYFIKTKRSFDPEAALTWLTEFEYANDGLVIRINDQTKARALGAADDYLQAVTALKPIPAAAITTVRAIEWTEGSRELSPVVIYDPVVLDGATCSRVSGHSVKNLIDCGALPGNKVVICRSGSVIPRLYNLSYASNFGL